VHVSATLGPVVDCSVMLTGNDLHTHRYRVAQLNLRQKEVNALRRAHNAGTKWSPSPNAVKVSDDALNVFVLVFAQE
jgi:hypothetical protein